MMFLLWNERSIFLIREEGQWFVCERDKSFTQAESNSRGFLSFFQAIPVCLYNIFNSILPVKSNSIRQLARVRAPMMPRAVTRRWGLTHWLTINNEKFSNVPNLQCSGRPHLERYSAFPGNSSRTLDGRRLSLIYPEVNTRCKKIAQENNSVLARWQEIR